MGRKDERIILYTGLRNREVKNAMCIASNIFYHATQRHAQERDNVQSCRAEELKICSREAFTEAGPVQTPSQISAISVVSGNRK
jgi:tryptophanase